MITAASLYVINGFRCSFDLCRSQKYDYDDDEKGERRTRDRVEIELEK